MAELPDCKNGIDALFRKEQTDILPVAATGLSDCGEVDL
jgi:hypothetical protein